MSFELRKFTAPDFTEEIFVNAPNAVLAESPFDAVAPEKLSCNEHISRIF